MGEAEREMLGYPLLSHSAYVDKKNFLKNSEAFSLSLSLSLSLPSLTK
jgi:hypothetical protein